MKECLAGFTGAAGQRPCFPNGPDVFPGASTTVRGTVIALANVVHKKERKNFQSTVGIVQASSNAISQGAQDYLFLLAFISLSLALLNLLPLLPLDGGHIAFSIVEGLRGRPLARSVYERVSMVGIALVLLLFFVGLSNDIGRLEPAAVVLTGRKEAYYSDFGGRPLSSGLPKLFGTTRPDTLGRRTSIRKCQDIGFAGVASTPGLIAETLRPREIRITVRDEQTFCLTFSAPLRLL